MSSRIQSNTILSEMCQEEPWALDNWLKWTKRDLGQSTIKSRIYPSIHLQNPLNPFGGHRIAGAIQLTVGQRLGTPWTDDQSVAGLHKHNQWKSNLIEDNLNKSQSVVTCRLFLQVSLKNSFRCVYCTEYRKKRRKNMLHKLPFWIDKSYFPVLAIKLTIYVRLLGEQCLFDCFSGVELSSSKK